MKKIVLLFNVAIAFVILLASCSGSNYGETGNLDITIPEGDDVDCCNDAEEYVTNTFLKEQHLIASYQTNQSKYIIKLYSAGSQFNMGYNDIYFAVEKTASGKHVKDFQISDVTPIMTMGKMNMQHSTPVGNVELLTTVPVYHSWISFLMSTDTLNSNSWDLSFNYTVKGTSDSISNKTISVSALSSGLTYIKSFKYNDQVYFLSLVNPGKFITGENTIQAYISSKSSTITVPYQLSDQQFVVDIAPTMPDMNNHTSPNNESLELQSDGSYIGKLNLTMTGTWNIHLTVKTTDGTVVAGGDSDDSGYSNLYWTINI